MVTVIKILIITLSSFFVQMKAQDPQPQKVYSIIKVFKEYDWYVQQYDLWKKELVKNKNQPDGWLSYYTAARMAKIIAPDEEKRKEWITKMEAIIPHMKSAIKGSYEYHYIQGYHEYDRFKGLEHIEKAYAIDPTRPESYGQLLISHEINREKTQLTAIAKQWKASGDLSPNLLLWNYNMLASTQKNAILITFGDNDTYPALVLQYADGVRNDVAVLNSNLLLEETYREKIFKELNIPALNGSIIEVKKIIQHITKHRAERPLYFGISGNYKALEIDHKLFNVGLAMLYDTTKTNSLSHLVGNFENNLLLNHLECTVYAEKFPNTVKRYQLYYVPALLLLHKHYTLSANFKKQKLLNKWIHNIVKGTKQETQILAVLTAQEILNK